jgi:hypothetical protein
MDELRASASGSVAAAVSVMQQQSTRTQSSDSTVMQSSTSVAAAEERVAPSSDEAAAEEARAALDEAMRLAAAALRGETFSDADAQQRQDRLRALYRELSLSEYSLSHRV